VSSLTEEEDRAFVAQAIALATEGARAGERPFGAVVVRDGAVLATGANRALSAGDTLAHAEVEALRAASQALGGTEDLTGAVVYASCEPCPVCVAAAALMGVERLVYAAAKEQAAAVGFEMSPLPTRLQALWREQGGQSIEHLPADDAGEPFAVWAERGGDAEAG
jgi:tRNA(Arg) A34 adenosine deaminase TadA